MIVAVVIGSIDSLEMLGVECKIELQRAHTSVLIILRAIPPDANGHLFEQCRLTIVGVSCPRVET